MKHSPAWRVSVQPLSALTDNKVHAEFFVLTAERKAKFTFSRHQLQACCTHIHLHPETAAACCEALAKCAEVTGDTLQDIYIDTLRSAYPARCLYAGEEYDGATTLSRSV